MTTPSSIQSLADSPELLRWVTGIERAAGPDAWVSIQVQKVDKGKIESVRVTCTRKCEDDSRSN